MEKEFKFSIITSDTDESLNYDNDLKVQSEKGDEIGTVHISKDDKGLHTYAFSIDIEGKKIPITATSYSNFFKSGRILIDTEKTRSPGKVVSFS